MATGNTHTKFSEDRTCSSEDMIADKHTHTDRQTDRLITILRSATGGGVTTRVYETSHYYRCIFLLTRRVWQWFMWTSRVADLAVTWLLAAIIAAASRALPRRNCMAPPSPAYGRRLTPSRRYLVHTVVQKTGHMRNFQFFKQLRLILANINNF